MSVRWTVKRKTMRMISYLRLCMVLELLSVNVNSTTLLDLELFAIIGTMESLRFETADHSPH